jgi:hypothetical protein
VTGTPISKPYSERFVVAEVVPFLNQIFQQDNARPHTARQTKDVLWQNNINVLE